MKIDRLHELIAAGNSLETISHMYSVPVRRLKAMIAREGSVPLAALDAAPALKLTCDHHERAKDETQLLMANTKIIEAADALHEALKSRYGMDLTIMLAYMYHRQLDPGMTPDGFQRRMDRGMLR